MDADTGRRPVVVGTEPPDPGDDGRDGVRSIRGGDLGAEPDERVAGRFALAVPRPAPADGDLELDHRLEPVDIRSLEQADLDESHGPGRIAPRMAGGSIGSRAHAGQSPRVGRMGALSIGPPPCSWPMRPMRFGATFDEESALTEAAWRRRLELPDRAVFVIDCKSRRPHGAGDGWAGTRLPRSWGRSMACGRARGPRTGSRRGAHRRRESMGDRGRLSGAGSRGHDDERAGDRPQRAGSASATAGIDTSSARAPGLTIQTSVMPLP